MKEIIIWTTISGLLFIVFLTTLIFGLIKKRRPTIILSLVTLLFVFGSASWTVYLFINKSYSKVTTMLTPRTGEEIYVALFGKTENKCLKVLNHQDQIVPKIDYAIWLYFDTCPDELKRILKLHEFKAEKVSTKGWQTTGPLANDNWFRPESLGDSILVFTYNKDKYGNGQTIYSSLDSTKVFCKDILD
jgi:hypothetical protein